MEEQGGTMLKTWERLGYDDVAKIRVGDTIGIVGGLNEIVTVVAISPAGHITTTSEARNRWHNHKFTGRRYFTARGREKGEGNSTSYNVPRLAGTLDVLRLQRGERYGRNVRALAEFTDMIRKRRAASGYSYDDRGEPITMDEYREIARLAKACLDDGWGDKRPTVFCLECWRERGHGHDRRCSKFVPPPEEPVDPPCPDGTCPGCGRSGDIPCPEDCPVLSHPPLPPARFPEALHALHTAADAAPGAT